jgi:hypothetical protein
LAFTNERTVAIPTDDGNLHYSLPASPTVQQAQPVPQTAGQTVAAAPSQQVIPAAYNQPAAQQPNPAAAPMPTAGTDSGSPWRSPQLPNGSPVSQAQYVQQQPQYQYQPQAAGQPTMLTAQQPQPQLQPTPTGPTMPVELRAVPTPAGTPAPMVAAQPAPVQPTTATPPPRMRFPSWTDPTTWFSSTPEGPPPGQQLVGYMVPGPNGQMQMVPVEQYQKMQAGAAGTPQTPVASSDGFRPRGSVK